MVAHESNRPPPASPLNPCGGRTAGPDELVVLGGRRTVITSPAPAQRAPRLGLEPPWKLHKLPTVDYAHTVGGFYGSAVNFEAPAHPSQRDYDAQCEPHLYAPLVADRMRERDGSYGRSESHSAHVYARPPPTTPQGDWRGHNHIWGSYVSELMPPEHAESTS